MKKDKDQVVIVEERCCSNCEIRRQARDLAQKFGADTAVRFRTPICVECSLNPSMIRVTKSPLLLGALKMMNLEPKNNWQPIKEIVEDHADESGQGEA